MVFNLMLPAGLCSHAWLFKSFIQNCTLNSGREGGKEGGTEEEKEGGTEGGKDKWTNRQAKRQMDRYICICTSLWVHVCTYVKISIKFIDVPVDCVTRYVSSNDGIA